MSKQPRPENLYKDVDDAARRIRQRSRKMYEDWVVIGGGLMREREAVLRRIGNRRNPLESHAYREGMTDWLRGRSADTQVLLRDKAVRSNLVALMDRFAEVTQWRDKLSPAEREDLNHPTSIMRAFNKASAAADPEKAEKKAKAKLETQSAAATRAALRMAQETITQQVAHIEDLEAGKDASPRDAGYFIAAIRGECGREEKREILAALTADLAEDSEDDQP